MPSAAASSGWIITSGRRSRASEVGVSVKLELRKPRAGEVASRNGCSVSASSITSQWSGQLRHAGGAWVRCQRAERHVRPIRLEAEFAVRVGEAVEKMRRGEIRLAVDPALASSAASVPQPEFCSAASISSRGVMAKPGCAAPSRSASAADHFVVGAAFAGRLDQLRPEQRYIGCRRP